MSACVKTSCRVAALLCLLAGSGLTSELCAQRAFELGLDAGVQLRGNGSDLTSVSYELPVSAVRAGLYVSPHVSLEAAVSATRVELDTFGSPTATAVEVLFAGLYHFGTDRTERRFHLLVGVPFRRTSASEGDSSISDTELGIVVAGIGVTLPVADRLGVRLQVRGIGWEGSSTRLSFLAGFSYLGGG